MTISEIAYRNIKHLCKKQGVKIGQLEIAIGKSAGYLSRSYCCMSLDDAVIIANFLDVTLDDLVDSKLSRKEEIAVRRAEIEALQEELAKLENEIALEDSPSY